MDDALRLKSMFIGQAPLDGFAKVRWLVPTTDAPGPWMPAIAPLVPFAAGYHLHAPRDLIDHHLSAGVRVWLAEGRGAVLPRGPGRLFDVCESARLVRELDWSHTTRWRAALATARDALSCAGAVEACLPRALDEAERLASPTPEALRAIEERELRPSFPRGLACWEEEIEDDPAGARRRRAAFDRFMTVSWALAADPSTTLTYALGAVGGGASAQRVRAAHEDRVWRALFLGDPPAVARSPPDVRRPGSCAPRRR